MPLALTRKAGEEIVLTVPAGCGPLEILIGFPKIDRQRVVVGITAPKAVRVMRSELLPKPAATPAVGQ
jgi:sRNA-binding carbon storage regulator CsrA